MCIFSPPVRVLMLPFTWLRKPRVRVQQTQIFARIDQDQQIIVYTMDMSSPSDVAMILPVPTRRDHGEQALSFVDLSTYPTFFVDLGSRFLIDCEAQPKSRGLRFSRPKLKVHRVGSFEASFVPTQGDFDRLDARFRLPQDVWSQLPSYIDDGFAVFKLRRGARRSVHPMAFRFATRTPERLYFPTTHVHEGRVKARERFRHLLYYQRKQGLVSDRDESSGAPVGEYVDTGRAKSLLDPTLPVYLHRKYGEHDNCDTYLPG